MQSKSIDTRGGLPIAQRPAARPVRSDEIVRSLAAIAAASDRVRIAEYGRSNSSRGLSLVTISSPANLARLDAVYAALQQLGDNPSAAVAEKLIAGLPVSVWVGCGIHGDEISGPEAALEAVRRLAEGRDEQTLAWLDKLIIHVDPNANPDGRERFLEHVTAFGRAMPGADPQDILHNAFWPDGRGNHYLFDLNRDAIFVVQAESRARVAAIRAAHPQLYIDAHEMAAADTYLFALPAEPLNPHLPTSVHQSWQDFGADHAAAFDADGTSFYTRSWNEVFYAGFFDIWPAYHGAVPILYEQASTSGSVIELPNGKRRSYREAIDNQLRSLFANLDTAVRLRGELLRRWWRARCESAQVKHGSPAAWLIPPGDAYKLRVATELLLAQGIRVERLDESVEIGAAHGFWTAEAKPATLPAGTLLVRCAQPLGSLARNVLDFHVPFTRPFLERERRGIDLGTRTLLFDVTSWSLPLAFGLDASWVEQSPPGKWTKLDAAAPMKNAGGLPRARYGYLIRDTSLHVTARLLEAGVKIRTARESFVHADTRYEPGTMLMRLDDQTVDVDAALERANSRGDAQVTSVDSARIFEGPDLGGREFELLKAPVIAVLTGAGMNAPNTGAMWHLFDAAIGMPVTLLELLRLPAVDLSRYNVLIFGDTDASVARRMLGTREIDQLRHWVHGGGTLLTLGTGTQLLAELGLGACVLRSQALDRHPPMLLGSPDKLAMPVMGPAARAFALPDTEEFSFPTRLPTRADWQIAIEEADIDAASMATAMRKYLPRGAYLRADFKPLHWLRYGVADRLPVLFRESDALLALGAAEVIGRYASAPELTISGLVWPEAAGYIAQSSYLTRERLGRGQVVCFANDPVFRGYSLGTQRLFLNAVILGPGLRCV